MSSFIKLKQSTDEFFQRHWSSASLPCQRPDWKVWENFLYGSVPNHDLGGCYVLFSGDELLYVGLGASRGGGPYPNHGISRRLTKHVIESDPQRGGDRSRLREPWNNVNAIFTIGFPNECAYLAAALEAFLIRELNPPSNIYGRSSTREVDMDLKTRLDKEIKLRKIRPKGIRFSVAAFEALDKDGLITRAAGGPGGLVEWALNVPWYSENIYAWCDPSFAGEYELPRLGDFPSTPSA